VKALHCRRRPILTAALMAKYLLRDSALIMRSCARALLDDLDGNGVPAC